MLIRTTLTQRRRLYIRHLNGETYQEIADSEGVSKWTVRYWCRRQRDGGDCQSRYRRVGKGPLSRSEPKVRYCVLRLRLEHPRWGPRSIRAKLVKRPSLQGLQIPSEASIGRYLHQWARFRRQARSHTRQARPQQPTQVHQRWQQDFKLGIVLEDGTLVNLHTVRDPVGEACIGAFVFPAGQDGQKPSRVTLEQARSSLRACFRQWGTLPAQVQTDHESTLVAQTKNPFPNTFTLWLKGLGIEHLLIRPGRPTDNAEVERCHRTINDYAIVGNEKADLAQLQAILDEAVYELNHELPSRAKNCRGLPPILAHPELLHPPRPFDSDRELALFDLTKVDAYLATFTWQRTVDSAGQVSLGNQRYFIQRPPPCRTVQIRFEPTDRHLVFSDLDSPHEEIVRRPIKGIDVPDLTGWAVWPSDLGPQQLPLPLTISEGVDC